MITALLVLLAWIVIGFPVAVLVGACIRYGTGGGSSDD